MNPRALRGSPPSARPDLPEHALRSGRSWGRPGGTDHAHPGLPGETGGEAFALWSRSWTWRDTGRRMVRRGRRFESGRGLSGKRVLFAAFGGSRRGRVAQSPRGRVISGQSSVEDCSYGITSTDREHRHRCPGALCAAFAYPPDHQRHGGARREPCMASPEDPVAAGAPRDARPTIASALETSLRTTPAPHALLRACVPVVLG
jgi:hypothetical protein